MSLNTDNLRSGSRDRQTSHQTTATARGNYDASCVVVSGRDLHATIYPWQIGAAMYLDANELTGEIRHLDYGV